MGSRVALPHNLGGEDGQHRGAKVVVGLHPFLVCEVRYSRSWMPPGPAGAHPLEELALDLNEAGDHLVDGRQLLLGTHAALVVHVLGGDGGISTKLPTRTMKNSSRLLVKMEINFNRSRVGTVSSAASSRTRRLKRSQLSSRFWV